MMVDIFYNIVIIRLKLLYYLYYIYTRYDFPNAIVKIEHGQFSPSPDKFSASPTPKTQTAFDGARKKKLSFKAIEILNYNNDIYEYYNIELRGSCIYIYNMRHGWEIAAYDGGEHFRLFTVSDESRSATVDALGSGARKGG